MSADLSLSIKFGKKDAENFESDYHVNYEETPYERALTPMKNLT